MLEIWEIELGRQKNFLFKAVKLMEVDHKLNLLQGIVKNGLLGLHNKTLVGNEKGHIFSKFNTLKFSRQKRKEKMKSMK